MKRVVLRKAESIVIHDSNEIFESLNKSNKTVATIKTMHKNLDFYSFFVVF